MISKLTKSELIAELSSAQARIAELEKLLAQNNSANDQPSPPPGNGARERTSDMRDTPGDSGDDRFRIFIEHSYDGILMFDERGIVDIWNRAQAEITGIPPEEAIGKPHWEVQYALLAPETRATGGREELITIMRKAFETGSQQMLDTPREVDIVAMNGKRKSVLVSAFAIDTARGYRIGSIFHDVTESRRALTALRESEQRFATTFHASPVAQLIAGLDTGRVLDANDAFCEQSGYPHDELIGRTTLELGLWVDPDRMRAIRDTLLAEGRVRELETTFRTRSGEFRTLLTSFERIVLNGEPCILSTGLDITERKQGEEKVRRSEERYQQFVAQSFEGIYRTEFDEPIDTSLPIETQIDLIYENAYMAECNRALAAMYHLPSVDALIGVRLLDAHGGKDNPVNRATFRKFIEQGYMSFNDETFEYTVDGEPIWFLSNTTGTIVDGKLVRMWGTCIDITERRRAEQALHTSEEKYRGLLESLDQRDFHL